MRKSSKNSKMRVLKHGKEYVLDEERAIICPECFIGKVRRGYFANGNEEIRRRGLFFDTILEQKRYICEGCGCEFAVETRKKRDFHPVIIRKFMAGTMAGTMLGMAFLLFLGFIVAVNLEVEWRYCGLILALCSGLAVVGIGLTLPNIE